MKKHLALGIAGASAALVGGWRLINELVHRESEQTDAVAVAPGVPAEEFTAPAEAASGDTGGKSDAGASPEAPQATKASKSSSKAELYEIAQDLEIEGRSKMTKDQLLKAIQQAG